MHGLGQQARAIGGVVVFRMLYRGFPVETIGDGAADAEGEVEGVFVIQGRSGFAATQLKRVEHALQLQQAAGLRVVVQGRGAATAGGQEAITAGAPELGAAAGLAVGVVVGGVAEQLQVFGYVEGAVDIGGVAGAGIPDRARAGLGERAAIGAAICRGDRGVVEGVAGRGIVEGVGVDRSAGAGIAADGDE